MPALHIRFSHADAVVIKGTPTQGQVLTVLNTLADIDGLGAKTYQWQNGGKDIADATQSTYVLTQNDVDKTISVKASYSDKFGATESVGSAATAKIVDVNDKPSGRGFMPTVIVVLTGKPRL